MIKNPDPTRWYPQRAGLESDRPDRDQPLNLAVRVLPSVQNQIAERAYQIYLRAGLPEDAAMEHWLAAENEVQSWIDSAINYVSAAPERARW